MAKPITVIYTCEDGCHTYTEDVLLLEEDDPIYTNHPVHGLTPIGKFGENETKLGVIEAGIVMFEDQDGLFGLYPEHIISIKER